MDNIKDFGRNSFVTHTTGLIERIKKMSDPEYKCLTCDKEFIEDELYQCPRCNEYLCPLCGGEVSTIQEYDEAMKANG